MACKASSPSLALCLTLSLLFSALFTASGYGTSCPTKVTCPTDPNKLVVCANLIDRLGNLVVGSAQKAPCCSLIAGLADLEAALCLCSALKANLLGLNLDLSLSLILLLNHCGGTVPSGFACS